MLTQKQNDFVAPKNSDLVAINMAAQHIRAANRKKAFDFMLKTLKQVNDWQISAGVSPVPSVKDAIQVAEISLL